MGAKTGLYIVNDEGRTSKKLKPLDYCPTLRAQSHSNEPKVMQFVNKPRFDKCEISDISQTIKVGGDVGGMLIIESNSSSNS